MIKAAIFDMDGLLIDSEPFWRKAETTVFNTVGIKLTETMMKQTMGLRVDAVVDHWFRRYPWKIPPSKQAIAKGIDETVIELINAHGKPLEGVYEALVLCKSLHLPIAIASSSSLRLIEVVIEKISIKKDIAVICSAHNEAYGKPHPAVYLTTLKELTKTLHTDLHAEECVVFEDSIHGVIAAKAARMHCIAIPHPEERTDKRFAVADHVLNSLAQLDTSLITDL